MNETEQQAIQTESTQPSVPVETPAEVASGSGSRSEFLQQLPEEIRDHPSLQSINDVGNLGLSFVNAQRLIGADKIPLPKNPTEDDLSNIYSKLGRPDEPSGYAIQADGQILTEGDVNTYTDIAHKLGLSKTQANGILDYYRSSIQQTTEAMSKAPDNVVSGFEAIIDETADESKSVQSSSNVPTMIIPEGVTKEQKKNQQNVSMFGGSGGGAVAAFDPAAEKRMFDKLNRIEEMLEQFSESGQFNNNMSPTRNSSKQNENKIRESINNLKKEEKLYEEITNTEFSIIQENNNNEFTPRSHG